MQERKTVGMEPLLSSYRDPAGYVAMDGGVVKRVVRRYGEADYRLYMESGLHAELGAAGLVLEHREESPGAGWPAEAARVLVPTPIPFVSYPYEWTFAQLRDAALLTLEIEERAMRRGMSLKDASAYNVQFDGRRPVFIDTLSFQADKGGAWVAYEQYCRQFLAPLLLMQYGAVGVNGFLSAALEGFPVQWTAGMLPWRSYGNPAAVMHIHLHAAIQRRHGNGGTGRGWGGGGQAKAGLVSSLRRAVEKMREPSRETEWQAYRETRTHYTPTARMAKRTAVRQILLRLGPGMVYDLGANDGEFSELAAESGARCVAVDGDANCVSRLYRRNRSGEEEWILPLVMDLCNPSPSVGFGNEERMSFAERGEADLTMVLGLVHHLRYRGNVPLRSVARFLARFSRRVLIEFIPPDDPKVAEMSRGRRGFDDYTPEGFAEAFARRFVLEDRIAILDSRRELFLYRRAG